MRIACPLCGSRDSREFTYRGAAVLMDRPDEADGMQDYVYLRGNVAGPNDELWHHTVGCSAWLKLRRDTVSHEILHVELARGVT